MESRIHYEERSGWPWWVHLLISLCLVAVLAPLSELAQGKTWGQGDAMPVGVVAACFLLGLGIPAGIYFFMGQLRVRVKDQGIEVAWGVAEAIRKMVPYQEIMEAESVTYSPLRDFGGWGIRFGASKKRAWTVSGNRALCLRLKDGTSFYVGSRKPGRLLSWVRSIGKGKMGGDTV